MLPARLNRRDPQALEAHNASVLIAHDMVRAWRQDPSDGKVEEKRKFLNMAILGEAFPVAESTTFPKVFPGAEGHTNPIEPTNQGTGLLRQKKAPRYDKDGHVT